VTNLLYKRFINILNNNNNNNNNNRVDDVDDETRLPVKDLQYSAN